MDEVVAFPYWLHFFRWTWVRNSTLPKTRWHSVLALFSVARACTAFVSGGRAYLCVPNGIFQPQNVHQECKYSRRSLWVRCDSNSTIECQELIWNWVYGRSGVLWYCYNATVFTICHYKSIHLLEKIENKLLLFSYYYYYYHYQRLVILTKSIKPKIGQNMTEKNLHRRS